MRIPHSQGGSIDDCEKPELHTGRPGTSRLRMCVPAVSPNVRLALGGTEAFWVTGEKRDFVQGP